CAWRPRLPRAERPGKHGANDARTTRGSLRSRGFRTGQGAGRRPGQGLMALPLRLPPLAAAARRTAAQQMTVMMFGYGNHWAFWPMGPRLDRDPRRRVPARERVISGG